MHILFAVTVMASCKSDNYGRTCTHVKNSIQNKLKGDFQFVLIILCAFVLVSLNSFNLNWKHQPAHNSFYNRTHWKCDFCIQEKLYIYYRRSNCFLENLRKKNQSLFSTSYHSIIIYWHYWYSQVHSFRFYCYGN